MKPVATRNPRICEICRVALAAEFGVFAFPQNRDMCRACFWGARVAVTFLRTKPNSWTQTKPIFDVRNN